MPQPDSFFIPTAYQLPSEYLLEPIRTIAYDLEKYLLAYIHSGNPAQISGTLSSLSNYIEEAPRKNPSVIRSRIKEFGSVLSRAYIENGIAPEHIHALLHIQHQSDALTGRDALYDIAAQMQGCFEECIRHLPQLRAGALTACRAQGYIARNYASRITLEEVAGYVHLNASYFSSTFKRNIGMSFKEFLNLYRIEMSKKLLKNTNSSILDIAVATGFEEQSYYTKMFKKYTGTSPSKFRY